MNLKLVETILSANGFEHISAETGEEGVSIAAREAVDLVLMDLQMPGIDGFEATRQIRLLPAHAETPIIAVSGNTTESDMKRTESEGFTAFVKKPFRIDELLKVIRENLPPQT